MTDKKVVPIGGRHRSFNSLAGEAMDDESWVRGYVIAFEKDGTMHTGSFGDTLSDLGMAIMYLQMLATEAMK